MADKDQNENEEIGRITGFGAGALTGAQLGTALIPIPFVGTFTGALIGGALGSKVGKQLGSSILDSIDTLTRPHAATDQQPDTDLLAQLERLGKLRKDGLLTDEEFSAAKAQLLNNS